MKEKFPCLHCPFANEIGLTNRASGRDLVTKAVMAGDPTTLNKLVGAACHCTVKWEERVKPQCVGLHPKVA
ncbi:MAG TPA: hypothetical protein VG895_05420 [Patescibacteria group bacterium]|nr:hypothetical protein [Patescibacteria group bacterium]